MVTQPLFWILLPLSSLIFWALPKARRTGFLALVSIGFLGWLAWEPVAMLLLWVVLFWFLVRGPDPEGKPRRSLHVWVILGILLQLGYFKYLPGLRAALSTNPMEELILIPLGISFFTFKLIHYGIEVARGAIVDRRFSDFLCYMFLFPVFTAGPIERFDHFLSNREHRWSLQSTTEGSTRIIYGLAKRFLVAEACIRPLLDGISKNLLADLNTLTPWQVWSYLLLSIVYIYFDFSAYSDIGIGASRLFGLRIMENFNNPFVACNISDFWKRWHISLSRWCQSYIYMPTMGFTRNPYFATVATFFVMGLWHAGTLNRIGWGMYHALGISVFVFWTQFKRKRGWKKLFQRPLLHFAGLPITLLFVAGSASFLVAEIQGRGLGGAARILDKLMPWNFV